MKKLVLSLVIALIAGSTTQATKVSNMTNETIRIKDTFGDFSTRTDSRELIIKPMENAKFHINIMTLDTLSIFIKSKLQFFVINLNEVLETDQTEITKVTITSHHEDTLDLEFTFLDGSTFSLFNVKA